MKLDELMKELPDGSTALPQRSLSHVALLFRPDEGPLAAELMRMFGFEVTDMGPHRDLPQHWYTCLVDPTSTLAGNVLFLMPAPPAHMAVEVELAKVLAANSTFAELDRFAAGDPERSFHFGLTYDSFDGLEEAALRLLDAGGPGGSLEGRVWKQTVFRPTPGISGRIDDRLRRSPIVKDDDRLCLGERGMQIWFKTDLLASNFLAIGQVLELNHVFPAEEGRETVAFRCPPPYVV